MSKYDEIQQVPITKILDALGIDYDLTSKSLYVDGKITSGWKLNTRCNYVCDFSNDRASGGPYSFIKSYLNLSDKEVFDRFKKYFYI